MSEFNCFQTLLNYLQDEIYRYLSGIESGIETEEEYDNTINESTFEITQDVVEHLTENDLEMVLKDIGSEIGHIINRLPCMSDICPHQINIDICIEYISRQLDLSFEGYQEYVSTHQDESDREEGEPFGEGESFGEGETN